MARRSDAETKANAEKYAADMKPHFDAQLEKDRGALVKAYRAHPGSWPDGIDSKYDRWYRPAEWADDGKYIGEDPCIRPPNPDAAPINAPAEKASKLDAGRAALAAVQERLGVKPVVVPEDNRKPWEIAGMSRSSWERRKKAEKGDAE